MQSNKSILSGRVQAFVREMEILGRYHAVALK